MRNEPTETILNTDCKYCGKQKHDGYNTKKI